MYWKRAHWAEDCSDGACLQSDFRQKLAADCKGDNPDDYTCVERVVSSSLSCYSPSSSTSSESHHGKNRSIVLMATLGKAVKSFSGPAVMDVAHSDRELFVVEKGRSFFW